MTRRSVNTHARGQTAAAKGSTMNIRQSMWISTLVAAVAYGPAVLAQTIYKCGNNYSQSPCPGGTAVDANDPRTPAQKTQADKSTAETARAAGRLERERLAAQKAQAAPASTKLAVMTAPKEPASAPRTQSAKPKKPTPEYFTAAVPLDKKKPTPKKKKNKEAANADNHVDKAEPNAKP